MSVAISQKPIINSTGVNIILFSIAAIVLYQVGKKFLQGLGIADDEADEKINNALTKLSKAKKNPLTATYTPPKIDGSKYRIFTMSVKNMTSLGDKMYKEIAAPLITDHASVVGMIKQFKTRAELNLAVKYILNGYKEDLKSVIDYNFSFHPDSRRAIYNAIIEMPDFVLK